MKDAVRRVFVPFITKYDGCVPWMYLDSHALVVVGIRCSLEPIDVALSLDWLRRGTTEKAELNEISRDWTLVKRNRLLAHQGPRRAQFHTGLDLTEASIEHLAFAAIDRIETELVQSRYPKFAEFPADAQLAILSMVWALEVPSGLQPLGLFNKAVNEQCWAVAGEHCFLPAEHRPELTPRNWAHRKLFVKAAETEKPDEITGWP